MVTQYPLAPQGTPLVCPGIHHRDLGPQSAPVPALGGALVCVAIAAAALLSPRREDLPPTRR
jgi:hypothetical protein